LPSPLPVPAVRHVARRSDRAVSFGLRKSIGAILPSASPAGFDTA
jgi:hypothetical protein